MKKLFFLPLAIICIQAYSQNDLQEKYAGVITGMELRKTPYHYCQRCI